MFREAKGQAFACWSLWSSYHNENQSVAERVKLSSKREGSNPHCLTGTNHWQPTAESQVVLNEKKVKIQNKDRAGSEQCRQSTVSQQCRTWIGFNQCFHGKFKKTPSLDTIWQDC